MTISFLTSKYPQGLLTTLSFRASSLLEPEKAMAPHSSTFAWKIPWTEEPGGLQSMGSLELDTTERLHFHFSLSCIGEGNGNPVQCSCLENPRDGEAWWAAVFGVAQSRTRLKRPSSSSSSSIAWTNPHVSWEITPGHNFILICFSPVFWTFNNLRIENSQVILTCPLWLLRVRLTTGPT